MVAALPAGGAAPVPPGLGDRGIVVHEPPPGAAGLLRAARVPRHRGALCDAGPRTLAFAGRQVVERFLAETGLKRADPSAYAVVQHDFVAAP
jgi:hypothetical protein